MFETAYSLPGRVQFVGISTTEHHCGPPNAACRAASGLFWERGSMASRNIKRELLGERIQRERIRRIAKALGADVVGKAPDAGGGAFGASRLARVWAQRWARLKLDLERLERATKRLAAVEWSVVEEDGYVKVRRGAETICAGVPDGPDGRKTGRLREVEFTDERHRKNNRTRQRAMRALRDAGWR